MAALQAITPSNLLVDVENPRLPLPNTGQREAQRELAKELQRKILALAGDIVSCGINPSDLPIVMPLDGDDLNRFVVLEGNRRLVAIRALENPDAFVGAFDPAVLKQLQDLSREYHKNPIESIQCVVVKERADANHWIELRHTGENEGAGIVRWASDESTRFKARNQRNLPIETQALNFMEEAGVLSPEDRRKIPTSSFKRLLGTPEIRDAIGLTLSNNKLELTGDPKKVAKALLHVATDLVDGKKKTEHIYTKEKRIEYAAELPESIKVKPTSKGKPLAAPAPPEPGNKASKATNRTSKAPARQRDVLIPRDCTMKITQARINRISIELRGLSLENYTNAVAVLFRVFIELSVDEHLKRNPGLNTNQDAKLNIKITAVLEDLLQKKKLDTQQAKPVRKALNKGSYLLPSIDLMHDYIHNQSAFPAPGDLRAHWDSLQPFMVAIWSI